MTFRNSDEPILSVRNLHKSYHRGSHALKGVDLDVRTGEFVAVIGRSGAGKSTLVRCINRLVEPSGGEIIFNGQSVTTLRGRALKTLRSQIGMVFQHHNLIARTPVLTNVLHGQLGEVPFYRSIAGAYAQTDKTEAMSLLSAVGLAEQATRRASTLSGGQMQRVGICRALMQRPRLLLADEPIASLDPAAAAVVMGQLQSAVRERGLACIINLHQVSFAKEYATRIIGMKDGAVVFDGAPDELTDNIIKDIYSEQPAAQAPPKKVRGAHSHHRGHAQKATCTSRGRISFLADEYNAAKTVTGKPRIFSFLPFLAVFLLVALSFQYINVNPLTVFSGFPRFVRFLSNNFFPPNIDYVSGSFSLIWARVLDTLLFAVVGTYISAVLAFLLGIVMSKELNPFRVVRGAVRFIVSFLRNVPLLVWATLMVFIFGIGAMVGVVALVLATLGFLARTYADSMDEIAATRLEALRSTGAGYWQVLFHGLVPSFIPAWINWTLFSFEINIRASAVLGMVGAGGLGFLIQTNLDLRGYRRAMSLILILMALVLATEFVMNLLRRKLAQQGRGLQDKPRIVQMLAKWVLPVAAAALFFISAHRLDLNLAVFISRMQNAGAVLSRFWVFNPAALPDIFRQLLVSVAIGICGLAVGCVISLVLAFLAAENIAPFKGLSYAIKGFVSLVRAVPSLVLILMVVSSLGFGAAAAVVGLVFSSVGYLTRAFISTIEEQEYAVIDAMRATGAGRLQIITSGLLPGVFSAFVAWVAIRLEANIADSVSLGIVGAGGVGMLIRRAVRQVNLPNLTTTIVVIFVAMFFIEIFTMWLRRKVK